MSKNDPILITGAGGAVGSVSKKMIEMLLKDGHRVRGFVRTDDERAQALRTMGVEVFVGDLLNPEDLAKAIKGCRRVYFSMSLNPYYTDATILLAAVARAQGNIEVFVNISEYEQSRMTYDLMTSSREVRAKEFGGLIADWSPQQRAHWSSEQALKWSGLPVVNIQATIFYENPIVSRFVLKPMLESGELHLPFGRQKLSPIAAYDVAELCAKILAEPKGHLNKDYVLTGPELIGAQDLAESYSTVIGRKITYVPHDPDEWSKAFIDKALAHNPHVAAHLKTLVKFVAGGFYNRVTGQLEELLGRAPKETLWALTQLPGLKKA
ncbi:NAD(P)H-binding protein [Bradyrhizobium pachyrhizi]|uniref:NAD(P)H-binding protein n=1 Tax=Bradyrhizobium pachyrhizi TaxID=280333 RepID=UPI00067D681D|nr:NAD(P)H-binding protein [Bradyrhizobium pachyrhizi]